MLHLYIVVSFAIKKGCQATLLSHNSVSREKHCATGDYSYLGAAGKNSLIPVAHSDMVFKIFSCFILFLIFTQGRLFTTVYFGLPSFQATYMHYCVVKLFPTTSTISRSLLFPTTSTMSRSFNFLNYVSLIT